MEGNTNFIASSQNQADQIMTGKRPEPSTTTDACADVTSKADLYDHLKNKLQVSKYYYNF